MHNVSFWNDANFRHRHKANHANNQTKIPLPRWDIQSINSMQMKSKKKITNKVLASADFSTVVPCANASLHVSKVLHENKLSTFLSLVKSLTTIMSLETPACNMMLQSTLCFQS